MREDTLHIAINSANIGIWEYDILQNSLVWNDQMYRLYGIRPDAFPAVYEAWEACVHPDDLEKAREELQLAIENKKDFDTDFRVVWPDGTNRYIKAKATVIRDSNSQAIRMIGTNWDITEQRIAEINLQGLHDELSCLFNSSTHVCIIGTDLTGTITHFNKGAEMLLGYTAEDVIRKATPGLFHIPEEIERRIEELRTKHGVTITGFELYEEHLKHGEYEDLYWTYRRKDGSLVKVQLAVSAITNPKGEITGMLGIASDATEKQEFESSLRESEQRWHKAFENAAIGMALVAPDGKWEKVNKSLCQIVGYTEPELLSKTFQDITHPDDLQNDLELVQKVLRGELENYHLEKRYLHKSGRAIWALLSVSLVRNKDKEPLYFIAQIQDITERKKAEEELGYLGRLVRDISDAVFSTDKDFKIKSWNKAAEELFGYPASEVINVCTRDFLKLNESDERRVQITNELIETGHWKGEINYFRKDGSQFSGLVSLAATKNSNNQLDGYVAYVRNIDDLKKLEAEQRETIDIVSEQNKRLLNFAHIVSHNLRSHSGNFAMLLNLYKEVSTDVERHELIRLMETASDRMLDTIDNLNEVVSVQININEQRKPLLLRKAIEKALEAVNAEVAQYKVNVTIDIPPDLTIQYVQSYLDSILLNFLTNAIKYRNPEKSAHITFKTELNGKSVILTIADNGLGIDLEKNKDKLFGMYKTFHDNKDARGIGLFITKNQVEAMGGKIDVESTVNEGTTFKVQLA